MLAKHLNGCQSCNFINLQLAVAVRLHVGNPTWGTVFETIYDVAWMFFTVAIRALSSYYACGERQDGGDGDDKLFDLHVGFGE